MIEKITLYDMEVIDIDGEFRSVRKNEEILPGLLTNHSLYVGKRDGLLDTSLTDELYNIYKTFGKDDNTNLKEEELEKYGEEVFEKMSKEIDEVKVLKIVYLSLVGANPNLEYSFDDFVLKYHASLEEKMETYVNLISQLANMSDNNFKKEFENKTSKRRSQGEKK